MNAPLSACWRADDARAIFVTEALEGDDAIFLATHTPIEGFEVAGRDAGEFAEQTNVPFWKPSRNRPGNMPSASSRANLDPVNPISSVGCRSIGPPPTENRCCSGAPMAVSKARCASLGIACRNSRTSSIISASGNAHPRKVAQTSFSARSPTRWSRATLTCPRSMMSGAGNMRPPSCWRTPNQVAVEESIAHLESSRRRRWRPQFRDGIVRPL